jgi:hypothetical protein
LHCVEGVHFALSGGALLHMVKGTQLTKCVLYGTSEYRVLSLYRAEGAHLTRMESAHSTQEGFDSFYTWLRAHFTRVDRVPIYIGYWVLILLCLQSAHCTQAVKLLF